MENLLKDCSFIFIFCMLAASMIFIKVYAAWRVIKEKQFDKVSELISTTDLATVLGFVSGIIILYNKNRSKTPPTDTNTPTA